jgi:hypothetical protein
MSIMITRRKAGRTGGFSVAAFVGEIARMQSLPTFVGKRLHVCKVFPRLLGRDCTYAKSSRVCWGEIARMQSRPAFAGKRLHGRNPVRAIFSCGRLWRMNGA